MSDEEGAGSRDAGGGMPSKLFTDDGQWKDEEHK